MGDVVLLELLKSRGLLPKFRAQIDTYVLIEDEALRGPSLQLVQHRREAGRTVEYSFTAMKPDKQFKRALELEAQWTARLEPAAGGELQVRLRNLRTREERLTTPDGAAGQLAGTAVEK